MAHGRTLFVSDLHLDGSASRSIALFTAFLRDTASASSGLIILGDLFESWIGDDDDDPARTAVCEALRALTAGGVACGVVRGNRDFLLDEGFAARTGCALLPDPAVLEFGSRRVAISHGDVLCTGDARYQAFRSLARLAGIRAGFLALPRPTRRALARLARGASREHTRAQRGEIVDVEPGAVAAMLRAADADLLIHGHTHRPGVHGLTVDGRARVRIVLGDWYESGSCLALDGDGGYELLALPAGIAP